MPRLRSLRRSVLFLLFWFLIVFVDFQYEMTKLQIKVVITLQTMPARNTRKQQQQQQQKKKLND